MDPVSLWAILVITCNGDTGACKKMVFPMGDASEEIVKRLADLTQRLYLVHDPWTSVQIIPCCDIPKSKSHPTVPALVPPQLPPLAPVPQYK